MLKFLIPLLILIAPHYASGVHQGDFMTDMSRLFKAGDSKEIAKNFNNSVALIIINEEDVYSKVQAEQILREFFNKHNSVNSSVIHQINTNPNMRFGILSLSTKNGNFRISVTTKKFNNAFLITELRIDPEK